MNAVVSRLGQGGQKQQLAVHLGDEESSSGGPVALGRITPIKVPASQVAGAAGGGAGGAPVPAPAPRPEDELEALDESPRRPIVTGAIIALLFFGGFGGWAAWAPLEGATIANGVVKVEGSAKAVQHPEGGVVKEILVQETEKVKANQVLVKLEDTSALTNLNVLLNQYFGLRAQEARLIAEMNRAPSITFPPELIERQSEIVVSEAILGQRQLFSARSTMLVGQTELLRKRVNELQEQIRGARGQAASRSAQRQSVQVELKSVQPMVDSGVITRTRVLDLERMAQRLQGEEHELLANVARDEQAIEQAKQQILQAINERVTQVASELRETQNRLGELEQRLQMARDTENRTEIRAPVEGRVLGLSVFTKGAVIARGEKIMEIIPDEQKLVVEGMVRVEDIAYIHTGMQAQVRLTGFRQREMPIVWGEVTQLSADRLMDPRTGIPYYRIEVKMDEKQLQINGQQLALYPGMPAMVMVPTGSRTAMDYFLRPIADSLTVAFREH